MDDETIIDDEVDTEFDRTQPIGNAINALAQAELIMVVADEIPDVSPD